MGKRILPTVEDRVRAYCDDHHGAMPLFVLLTPDDANQFVDEVRRAEGYDENTPITEFKGVKIVSHVPLKDGEMLMTNELPETSS